MLRVLIAEDSPTTRELLVGILASDPTIEIVGEAKNGAEVVRMAKQLRPDIITMDIRMPVMDGFDATKQIMVEAPTPIVIVSASVDVGEVAFSMRALRAGALTVLAKPAGPLSPAYDEERRLFLNTLHSMAQVKVVRHWGEGPFLRAPPPPTFEGARATRVLAIAASTGGPAALSEVLSALPRDFPMPVLVVQHMAHGFIAGFASWLDSTIALKAKVAEPGERLLAGTVYLGPDDRHLGVDSAQCAVISAVPPVGGFRPSGTYLFTSVAKIFGGAALAVMLTGMGSDGVEGLADIRRAGGRILVQDEGTCVVFGMPGAAIAAGLADSILPLQAIGPRILQVTGTK